MSGNRVWAVGLDLAQNFFGEPPTLGLQVSTWRPRLANPQPALKPETAVRR